MEKITLTNLQQQCTSINHEVNYLKEIIIQLQDIIKKMEQEIEELKTKAEKPKKVYCIKILSK